MHFQIAMSITRRRAPVRWVIVSTSLARALIRQIKSNLSNQSDKSNQSIISNQIRSFDLVRLIKSIKSIQSNQINKFNLSINRINSQLRPGRRDGVRDDLACLHPAAHVWPAQEQGRLRALPSHRIGERSDSMIHLI